MKIEDVLTIHDTLNPKFWVGEQLKKQVLINLRSVAQDFFNDLGLEDVMFDDITFTGSSANFNYTKFSDIDLHILVDFKLIDENEDLVKEFFNGKTSNWNNKHKIMIFDHEIELYVQNSSEPHHSTGVYSIANEDWIRKPVRQEPEIDLNMVKRKVKSFIDMIERAEDLYDANKYLDAHKFSLKLIKKIKKFRQSGLEDKGEYSYENLTFKYLRNREHMKRLFDLRSDSYDKEMSLDGKFDKKFNIFINMDEIDEKKGFYRLDEEEKYQKLVKRRHQRHKNKLLSLGRQDPRPPFTKKPSYGRSKSAPAGSGGS
jgi:predicted nucleotidyltransferase